METSIFCSDISSKNPRFKMVAFEKWKNFEGGHQSSAVPKTIHLEAGKTFKTTAFLKPPVPGPGPSGGSRLGHLRLEVP